MKNWLDVPKNRKRLPVGQLCLIMALTVLLLLAAVGRKALVVGAAGLVVPGLG